MMKGAGSVGREEIERLNEERDVRDAAKRPSTRVWIGPPDVNEGYLDWHSIVGDDDLEDNPNT